MMSIYLLLFDHYEENTEGDNYNMYDSEKDEDDTLAEEQRQAIANLPKRKHPPGHPIYVRDGVNFIEVKPGSKEAGYRSINGNLQKV